MKLPVTTCALLLAGILAAGCSGIGSSFRINCSNELEAAWRELDIVKARGLAGTVSYTKALGLISAARAMQTVENFDGCYKNANKARFYIAESLEGR